MIGHGQRRLREMKFALTLLGASVSLTASETILVDDPLHSSTLGDVVGGQLTENGYMPGLGTGHLLYTLPPLGPAGFVEVEILGMDAQAVPPNADHGFLAMYDGRGVIEPAEYFRDLKQNYFRWNVHWRNSRKLGLKCVVACAAPTVERREAQIAQFPARHRDWFTEPTGDEVAWDPQTWHRLRVEWRPGQFRVLVDGVSVWQAEGPYDYTPVQHRLWLGSAPAHQLKYPCLVAGMVYRNFKAGTLTPAETTPLP